MTPGLMCPYRGFLKGHGLNLSSISGKRAIMQARIEKIPELPLDYLIGGLKSFDLDSVEAWRFPVHHSADRMPDFCFIERWDIVRLRRVVPQLMFCSLGDCVIRRVVWGQGIQ